MKKVKCLIIVIVFIYSILVMPIIVKAEDEIISCSVINGVTVNWTYTVNESNEIEALKCTNVSELVGNITIPSTIDGMTVVSIGNEGFKSSTGLTGLIIPDSVKDIGLWAFQDCTSLKDVDLGSIEGISEAAFKGCTSLESIIITKTLKSGAAGPVFSGCDKLTTITLEEGITIVPSYICADTDITEITIPNSVKEIGLWAFQDCTSLKEVDLGSIEKISEAAFKGCTSLESIVIPKTLKSGAAGPVFSGCDKLTTITLEEGITIVPSYICADTDITEITIPNSVKEIGLWAFQDCTSLKEVDLGSIEKISEAAFKGCTSLESIVIPKTLKSGAAGPVFSGCDKLKTITLKEGITIVPSYLCANTDITEITIPNSVTEIGHYAFKDCTKLEKITILDNINKMGFYISQPKNDTVFTNHNENLTIYCYEGSFVAKYAIDNNIKYVYLPRTEFPDEDENNKNSGEQNGDKQNPVIPNNNNSNQDVIDTTVVPGKLPNAGLDITIGFIIVFTIVVAIVLYNKHRKLNDI